MSTAPVKLHTANRLPSGDTAAALRTYSSVCRRVNNSSPEVKFQTTTDRSSKVAKRSPSGKGSRAAKRLLQPCRIPRRVSCVEMPNVSTPPSSVIQANVSPASIYAFSIGQTIPYLILQELASYMMESFVSSYSP
eukprot:CAMPEP_0176322458 /NCGR_PEP_ID=MMETSP0121_2-20121125/71880_1 /TAXON_ID=160619 /ORGANISM="Kryptoperidinium foliaceum, Strain CCMP 1326" /LENGTH=134 /DNA_ID=CAMNT_0017664943 /DNA_START=337 /DNA_END=741 /DNA_ORIENTATION=+